MRKWTDPHRNQGHEEAALARLDVRLRTAGVQLCHEPYQRSPTGRRRRTCYRKEKKVNERRMKLVYVAGPYRGETEWDVERNIREAEEVAADVWKSGAVAICPHKNTAHFGGLVADQTFLDGDIEILRRCDALIVTPNWEISAGAVKEVSFATEAMIPVFFNIKDFCNWMWLVQ